MLQGACSAQQTVWAAARPHKREGANSSLSVLHTRNSRSRCDPLVVSLQFQAKFIVEHPEVAIATSCDRHGHERLYLLGHYADIGFVTAVICEAIEAETIVELAEKNDVVLQPDIRSATATTSTAAAHSAASRGTKATAARTHSDASCAAAMAAH